MNRKLQKYLLIACFMLFGQMLMSVPAYPDLISFVQPDGTKVSIYLKGDEYIKWAKSEDGYTLMYNDQGFFEFAMYNGVGDMIPSGYVAKSVHDRDLSTEMFVKSLPKDVFYSDSQMSVLQQIRSIKQAEAQANRAFPTSGNRKLICILIGFSDKAFTKTQAEFNSLFNQVGYNTGGATGSVKDYHLENSYGQLNLTVDVVGPYTASQNMAYYGGNDASGNDRRPRELVREAVILADPHVNFADYDNDNDGKVDGVYVIYAGYGEEAGGGENAIWAHQWSLSPAEVRDGKQIITYSCSAELRGSSGSNITHIGVICHEFGHVLGALDYYDTDYGEGGQYDGAGQWCLMAAGAWNNGGATPAHHNGFTKVQYYNWATATVLVNPITVTLNNAAQHSNSFYRINTTTANEYFLIENREKHLFDAHIPGSGMMIYKVHADVLNAGSTNSINVTHPQKMYPVAQNATTNPSSTPASYGTINAANCAWTGAPGKTAFTDASTPNARSWAGANTNKPITNIARNATAKTVSFCFIDCVAPCTTPTTQASNFSATAIGNNQMTVNWTRGNGTSVMVVARQGSAVNLEPTSGTAYTANTTFGNGNEIGTGNFVVYKGTANNATITGLIAGTTYHFAVYEMFTADNCYRTPSLNGNATTTGTPPCSYCQSYGDMSYATSTTGVIFNTINNSSAKPADGNGNAYSNYTAISTEVSRGNSFPLTVRVNTDGNYQAGTKVWIDWNQNCIFDAGEEYDLGTAVNQTNGNTSNSPLSITVPAGASLGATRMRVSTQYGVAPTACQTTSFDGEVEDYTIIVINAACTPVAITSQPAANQTVCTLASASFAVVASGTTPITYQWQYNNSGTWTNVANGTPTGATYSNATTATMSVSGISAAGSYQYRALLTNCSGANNATSNTATLLVNTVPAQPSVITGTAAVCQGQNNVAYAVTNVAGVTYTWAYSGTGATITGQGTNSISVNYSASATSGTWTVTPSNACGNGTARTYSVTVNIVPAQPSVITGTAAVCQSQNNVAYAVTNVAGVTYTWAYSGTGATITGQGTNSISVNYSASATSGTWTVTPSNACGNGTARTYSVTVNNVPAQPSVITGTVAVCQGQNNVTYAVTNVAGVTYTWVYSGTGATITGQGTNSISVNYSASATSGTWAVTPSNACGNGTARTYSVTVNNVPAQPSVITGTAAVCQSQNNVAYAVTNVAGVTYTWVYSGTGATITGQGTNSISVNYSASATSGTWTVTPSNACGNGTARTYSVTVNNVPDEPQVSVDCTAGFGNAVVTITSPLGAGLQYSLNGGAYQSSTIFSGVSNGNHVITVQNNGLCETVGSSFSVSCGCANPTVLNLSTTSIETCGLTPVVIGGNIFGGSATQVSISHLGGGTLNSNTHSVSPFEIVYTPNASDLGQNIVLTVTTNNPNGSPCVASEHTITIQVLESEIPEFSQVGEICANDELLPLPTISNNGINGTWSPAINNQQTTTYTFTPLSGFCATIAQMTIEVNQPTIPVFASVGPYCDGETIEGLPTISNNGIAGTWSPAIDNSQTTTYTFVPDIQYCTQNAEMTIVVNPIPATPTIVQNGNVLHSDATIGNQWFNASGMLIGETNAIYSVSENGSYHVVVTLLGCSSEPSNIINVSNTQIGSDANESIKIFPNPFENTLVLEMPMIDKMVKVEILNSLGQKVFTSNFMNRLIINTNDFAPGVYYVKLENNEFVEIIKMIKK